MFFAPGVTLTPITLLGSGCGVSTVGIDRVAVEGSDDGIDGGSVVERVGPVHQGN